ncbi:hypothetical protein SAMN05421636_10148 [Pricia antarctica]|uniref:Uncharacterized protein n=1 Tax=Pricia antarctica TaxID=641691 RepID=A0A1G6VUG1_9FLAO|nr:hypothetical protein SAMN05421636_10148 [Pricia antarctica]
MFSELSGNGLTYFHRSIRTLTGDGVEKKNEREQGCCSCLLCDFVLSLNFKCTRIRPNYNN